MTDEPRTTATESAVDAVADQYVADSCLLDPLLATYFGISGYDHDLPDISPDGFDAREQLAPQALSDLQQADATDSRQQIARDAFSERLSVAVDQYEAKTPQSQISVISSELHSIRGAFALMKTGDDESWSNINSRL